MPLYLKSCRRCYGDMYINEDMYGAYLDCLQCGDMPKQLMIKSSNRKETGISIDAHIKTLWVLSSREKVSTFSHDGLIKDEPLEKRLKAMAQYGYISVESFNGNTDAPENGNYHITSKGREALGAYMGLVKKVLDTPKSKKDKISSYELVDENGKLTSIGKHFIRASSIIAEFVDNIYPTATISMEHPETLEKQENRAV